MRHAHLHKEFFDKMLEENPNLVRDDCIYKKKYNDGEENLTLYKMIEMANERGLDSICDLDIKNSYCDECPYKKKI